MVDLILLDTIDDSLGAYLRVSREFERTDDYGIERTFFSSRTIFDSTVMIVNDPGAGEIGYLGNVSVGSKIMFLRKLVAD